MAENPEPSAEALLAAKWFGLPDSYERLAVVLDAFAAAARAEERERCAREWAGGDRSLIASWIALNECLGFLARCEGDTAARAWNSFAGLMDEWAAQLIHSEAKP